MATLLELRALTRDSNLKQKVEGAVMVAADAIRVEAGATANHANRLIWAKQAFASPASKVDGILSAVLAANAAFTVAQIQGASDTAIQNNVSAVIDLFADGT